MRSLDRFSRAVVVAAVAVAAGAVGLAAQTRAEQEKQREQWQRVTDIFRAMGVKTGSVVADVGSGDGFFTSRLATAVGPTGHVYAVDVSDAALDRLRRRLADESHRNVTVIKGTGTDPRLPANSIDAALIINAYHEMPEHQAMLSALRGALKADGRLVIVEPVSESRRAASRTDLVREHEITPELAMQDARLAGLRIVGLEDPFTIRGRVTEWMMTVTPSAAAGRAPVTTVPVAPPDPSADAWRDRALRIAVEDLAQLIAASGATIIDVRDDASFARGHIPNALLIPSEDVESSAGKLRTLKRPIITYCS